MMSPTLIGFLSALCILTLIIVYLTAALLKYKNLCVKLTKVIKDMYCKEEGCNNYRYNTAPIDNTKGYMSDYCALHLAESVEDAAPKTD